MNFSSRQWTFCIALDLLIKIVFVTFFGVLFTLGAVPVSFFVFDAVVLSICHWVCLFLGSKFALAFELIHLKLSPAMNVLITLFVANILFVGGFPGFSILFAHKGDIGPGMYNDLIKG